MQLQDRNQKHRKDWGRQSAYFGMFLALLCGNFDSDFFRNPGHQAWTGEYCHSDSALLCRDEGGLCVGDSSKYFDRLSVWESVCYFL